MNNVTPGLYRHYKNILCRVLFTAKHSETKEEMVVYVAIDEKDSPIWVRPLKMFVEKVTVNGKKVPRFKKLG